MLYGGLRNVRMIDILGLSGYWTRVKRKIYLRLTASSAVVTDVTGVDIGQG